MKRLLTEEQRKALMDDIKRRRELEQTICNCAEDILHCRVEITRKYTYGALAKAHGISQSTVRNYMKGRPN